MIKASFKQQAKEALSKCKIIDNNDGTIDITGDLTARFPFEYLPRIKNLNGDFNCSYNHSITNLKNSPINVSGSFYCFNCDNLKTLKGAPQKVGGSFYCHDCDSLISLKQVPFLKNGTIEYDNCKSLKPNTKPEWLKKQESNKKRIILENCSINQDESTWKHTT